MRLGGTAAVVISLACLASGCSTSSSTASRPQSPASTPASRPWSIVALGDSVPSGANCDCRPYPPLTADDLAAKTHRAASAANDAVGGATSADVLAQVRSDATIIGHVRAADAIEIEIGANDVSHSKSCGTAVDCYSPRLPPLEKNLAAIVARVRELTSGRKVVVSLLDYWSVWLGGKYAAAKGPAYVSAAEEMTDRVNTIVKETAARTHSHYVDLRAAFKGPDYAYDETHYLSNDGDHPNAAGHAQIAKAVETEVGDALR